MHGIFDLTATAGAVQVRVCVLYSQVACQLSMLKIECCTDRTVTKNLKSLKEK